MKALPFALWVGGLFLLMGFTFNAINADGGAMFWLALFLFGVVNLAWWAVDRQRGRR